MYRLALILLIIYSVVQAYDRETNQLPVEKEDEILLKERIYDLFLQEREITSCGIQDAYLNCARVNHCFNNQCPNGQHCCSTSGCGNICLCNPHPANCSTFCRYGYKTGPDGCYTCSCNPINLKRLLRRLLDKKEKQSTEEETE